VNSIDKSLRLSVLALAVILALVSSLSAVEAQVAHRQQAAVQKTPGSPSKGLNQGTSPPPGRLNDPTLPRANFMGMITSVVPQPSNPDGDPISFRLELGTQAEDIHLFGATVITGKSAEAVVEGMSSSDYAVVRAKRYKGVWYAMRIVFDVQPVPPLRLLSASFVRLSVDGKRMFVKPDSGKGLIVLRLVPRTRYHVDNQPVDVAPVLQPQESLRALIQRVNQTWIAWDVYTKTTL
jgi:hypothetical protein